MNWWINMQNVVYLKKYVIYLFSERGRNRERNINVWLPLEHPLLGTWPATRACALTGNWSGDPLVRRSALNALSHTSQGKMWYIYIIKYHLIITRNEVLLYDTTWIVFMNINFMCQVVRTQGDEYVYDLDYSNSFPGRYIKQNLSDFIVLTCEIHCVSIIYQCNW